MSWNNVMPVWSLNQTLRKAVADYENKEISHIEVYERIKNIEEIPESVKQNWKGE